MKARFSSSYLPMNRQKNDDSLEVFLLICFVIESMCGGEKWPSLLQNHISTFIDSCRRWCKPSTDWWTHVCIDKTKWEDLCLLTHTRARRRGGSERERKKKGSMLFLRITFEKSFVEGVSKVLVDKNTEKKPSFLPDHENHLPYHQNDSSRDLYHDKSGEHQVTTRNHRDRHRLKSFSMWRISSRMNEGTNEWNRAQPLTIGTKEKTG